jgi:hypothetical protein
MSKLPDPTSPTFIKLTDRRQELLVVSPVEAWISHWDNNLHRSRRCAGATCALCHVGVPRKIRFIVMVIDGAGHEKLLELRERHRALCESLNAVIESGFGARIVARKEGKAVNSPLDVRFLEKQEAYIREIRKLVDCFGLAPKSDRLLEGIAAQIDQPEDLNVGS